MTNNFYLNRRNGGFLVLTLTLLVSAVILVIVTGSLLRSTRDIIKTADSEKSLKAWSVVNACAEYALGQLASTSDTVLGWSYAGGNSLSVGGETCYIYPIEASSTSKLIKASSTVANFTKKLLIEVATNTPRMIITSWKEVADF
jgi:hypothetical protein